MRAKDARHVADEFQDILEDHALRRGAIDREQRGALGNDYRFWVGILRENNSIDSIWPVGEVKTHPSTLANELEVL